MTAEQVKAMVDGLKVRVPVIDYTPATNGRRSADKPQPAVPKE